AFQANTEFQVNTHTTHYQIRPAVAADGAGNFVVVWQSFAQDTPLSWGVFGQRYDSTGLPLGGEFEVNSYTTGDQGEPSVGADGAGNFVVVWDSGFQDGSYLGVFGRRYDASGVPLGGEFQVNTYTTGRQGPAAVAVDGAGNFVVVWTSD